MTLSKIALELDQSQYQVVLPDEVLQVQVQNGPSWRRRDFFGAPSMVAVQWVLAKIEYQYIMTFWRRTLVNGTLPFLIDLVIDGPDMAEYQAKIVKGTFRLNSRAGEAHFVSATLEVKQVPGDDEFDDLVLMLFAEYGEQLALVINDFEYIANVLLPASWGEAAG